jgi:flagellar motor switch protein FliM
MSQVLSQNEVDALLSAVSDGDIETETDELDSSSDVIVYDLTSQDRIIRGRMPTLEIVYERFVRNFRMSLSQMLHKIATINVSSTDLLKFGEFMNTLPLPSCMNVLRFESLRGSAIMVVESKLAYALVDSFFGGTDRPYTKIEGKEFTQIEVSIVQKIVKAAIDDLEKAWAPVHRMDIAFSRTELNPQFVGIVPPGDVILATTFEVELENASGIVTLVIPYSTIEPIKEKLNTAFQTETMEVDNIFSQILEKQLNETAVNVLVELGQTSITVGDLVNLEVGDVLPLAQDSSGELTVQVEGIPKYKGVFGTCRGSNSIQVTSVIERKEDLELANNMKKSEMRVSEESGPDFDPYN